MSRYARIPLEIPQGVEMTLEPSLARVKGKLGEMDFRIPVRISVEQKENLLWIRASDDKDIKAKSAIGLTYKILSNMIRGVVEGFQKQLDFSGVGYRITIKGDDLTMQLGFSHDVHYRIPGGISVEIKGNIVTISGIDKELVGRVADQIKSYRPIEPYKGKGIKYVGQYVLKKAGKAGKTGSK